MSAQFQHTQLDNGLTIIAETQPEAHTTAVGFFVNVGTRDETMPIMGVSHFLEHMMFKGTPHRTADQVNRDFDRIGASYNAFTSQEMTAYYAHVLPEYLPEATDILADILRPSLRKEDFEMEKNVIIEEIGMYRDQPFWVIHEQSMERYFGRHPLAYRVLGTDRSIRLLERDAMADYFAHRYSPDNIVISLSGALDFDQTIEQIKQLCGDWQPTGAKREYPEVSIGTGEQTRDDATLTNFYVTGVMPGPDQEDELRYAATVLAGVLGDDDGSRLYWRLIDTGLADEADFFYNPFDRAGTFIAFASCPPRNAEQVEAGLFEVIDQAGRDLSDDEIQRTGNKLRVGLTMQNERPAGRMMMLGKTWLNNREYVSVADELERFKAVDQDQICAVVERFDFTQRAIVRCGPSARADDA